MKLKKSDIVEIIGSFVPPALAVLVIARFVLLYPENPAWVVFHYFGMLIVIWYIFGKINEILFDDKVDILMSRLYPLINLFILIVYLGIISFLCIFCMIAFNPYLLLALACIGIYIPLLLFWGLLTVPYFRKDESHDEGSSPEQRKKVAPPADKYKNTATPRSQVLCRVCGIPVTNWLWEPDIRLINKLNNDKYEDGAPLLPQGIILDINYILEKNESFWGAENSEIIVNLNDLVHTCNGGVRNGCCGVDGSDGINIFCVNNHPIGTEVSDCYQPEFAHLPTECIVVESGTAGFASIVPQEVRENTRDQKKKHHNYLYTQFPDGFDTKKKIKIEAEFFRLALTSGLVGIKDVVRWADKMIEKGNEEHTFLDLSLASDKSSGKVTELLGQFPGHCEWAFPVKIVLAHCHALITNRKKSPEEILLALGDIKGANRVPEPVKNDIDWFEELRYMAKSDEFTNITQAGNEITLYVAEYAKYSRLAPPIRE